MRSAKQERKYRKHRKHTTQTTCSFCSIEQGDKQFVEDTKHFKIIRNRFAYGFWDGQGVSDHLMVIPKQHISSLTGLDSTAKIEYVDILQKYEMSGYNVYARAPQSIMKSIVHQHTHLIKTDNKIKRLVVSIAKPLIRIIR